MGGEHNNTICDRGSYGEGDLTQSADGESVATMGALSMRGWNGGIPLAATRIAPATPRGDRERRANPFPLPGSSNVVKGHILNIQRTHWEPVCL